MPLNDKQYLYEFRFSRHRLEFPLEGRKLNNPQTAAMLLKHLCYEDDRERFYAIYLDAKTSVIGYECVAVGSAYGVGVHPREVFRGAILAGAYSIILGHNHPSGSYEASAEDISITQKLTAAGEIIGIAVVDHIIATDSGTKSCIDAC
jgi:DNA repair protein RadC